VVGGTVVIVTMCWVAKWVWSELIRGVNNLSAVWYCDERGPCL
jgi:hypothetical protein